MGGEKGEGETSGLFTPTSILPHQGGGGCLGNCQMARPVGGELHYMFFSNWLAAVSRGSHVGPNGGA